MLADSVIMATGAEPPGVITLSDMDISSNGFMKVNDYL